MGHMSRLMTQPIGEFAGLSMGGDSPFLDQSSQGLVFFPPGKVQGGTNLLRAGLADQREVLDDSDVVGVCGHIRPTR